MSRKKTTTNLTKRTEPYSQSSAVLQPLRKAVCKTAAKLYKFEEGENALRPKIRAIGSPRAGEETKK